MDAIRAYFDRLYPLQDAEWEAMEACFRWVSFTKGEMILAEGKTCDFIGFIREGIIRFYHLKEGTDKVTAFWFAGDFLSDYRSFVSGMPSSHFIEALTDGAYWRLDKQALNRLYDQYPAIERLGRLMAERLYLVVTQRLDTLLHDTPEERYRSLLNRNSRLLQEIPQFMIASYLGVSAETLSRIRKRISDKASS